MFDMFFEQVVLNTIYWLTHFWRVIKIHASAIFYDINVLFQFGTGPFYFWYFIDLMQGTQLPQLAHNAHRLAVTHNPSITSRCL